MDVFTVSLFGHREVSDLKKFEEKLITIVNDLLSEKRYVVFFIGRNGEFDEYAASVIKRVQNKYGKENSNLTLILPYAVADIEYYDKYYDDIIIPEELSGVHPKLKITLRNKWMAENCALVICYIEREEGGAYFFIPSL